MKTLSKIAKSAMVIALVTGCSFQAFAFSPESIGKLLSARNLKIGMICRRVGGKLSEIFASPERKAMNKAAREIEAAVRKGDDDFQAVVRKYGCSICRGQGGFPCIPAYPTFNGWAICTKCNGEGFVRCTFCDGTGFPILAALLRALNDE